MRAFSPIGAPVRFRLGAFFRTWDSLVIPPALEAGDRWFESSRPDSLMRWVLCWYGKATVNRRDAGSIPASAALWKGKPMGERQSCFENSPSDEP